MLKSTLAAALLGFVMIAPAYAQDMMCDDASMMKMKTDMDAMTDPAMKEKKEMAMKEMDMAKESMAANKMDDCKMHMENAKKGMSNG